MAVLNLSGVKRSFHQAHKAVHVLKGVDLTVEPGELIALIGSSGSGKSTLLQIAGLLDSNYDGEIRIEGKSVSGLKDEALSAIRREKLGFIYQFHHLLPDFTALENVAMALYLNGFAKVEAHKKAAEVLEQLGLGDRLDHVPSKLSGGEQQRVAIGRAIVAGPALLLADEPTGNLDEETAARVLELFLATVRERKLAAVIATHDKALAAKLDRQLILQDGHLSSL